MIAKSINMLDAKQKYHLDFPFQAKWVNQQMQEAFTQGIPQEWRNAERLTTKGQTTRVRKILQKIQNLADKTIQCAQRTAPCP